MAPYSVTQARDIYAFGRSTARKNLVRWPGHGVLDRETDERARKARKGFVACGGFTSRLYCLLRIYAYLAKGQWFRQVSKVGTASLGQQTYGLGVLWSGESVEAILSG